MNRILSKFGAAVRRRWEGRMWASLMGSNSLDETNWNHDLNDVLQEIWYITRKMDAQVEWEDIETAMDLGDLIKLAGWMLPPIYCFSIVAHDTVFNKPRTYVLSGHRTLELAEKHLEAWKGMRPSKKIEIIEHHPCPLNQCRMDDWEGPVRY